VLTLLSPPETWAWGNAGHEAVAYVAWQQMDASVQKRVLELLKLVPTLQNPNNPAKFIPGYKEWVQDLPAGLSQDRQNLYLFMRAATWPDTIKHRWLRDSDTPPANMTTDDNIGYTDTASHGYWYFVDAAFASDKSTLPATPEPNAATQIAALRTAIASNEADLLKSYDLVWLEHIVGDIHQPLHGTTRYFGGKGDLGGNLVKIKLPPAMQTQFKGSLGKSAPSELDAFWDDLPGEGDPGPVSPVAETFAKMLSPAAKTAVADTDPSHWAAESLTLAKVDGYKMPPLGPGLTPNNASSYAIPQGYFDAAMKDGKDRVALAGARLAKLLNDNLR
jgi:S1/P1 Nuclease